MGAVMGGGGVEEIAATGAGWGGLEGGIQPEAVLRGDHQLQLEPLQSAALFATGLGGLAARVRRAVAIEIVTGDHTQADRLLHHLQDALAAEAELGGEIAPFDEALAGVVGLGEAE